MDLQQIRYFLETVAAGSLSRAAVRLGISQPALSRQIGNLEASLQQNLLYRHGRGVSLTDAGRRFEEVAQDVMRRLADVRTELAAGELDCPSSDDLRLFRRLRNGGSGSSGFEVMRPAAGAASVCAGWSGA